MLLLVISLPVSAQQKFRNEDEKVVVFRGDEVEIMADTAYIVSHRQALLLNQKLDELDQLSNYYGALEDKNSVLLKKMKALDRLTTRLIQRIDRKGKYEHLEFDEILTGLDQGLESMKRSNQQLRRNNQLLEAQLQALDETIQQLKSEMRGIWWSGTIDKLVVGITGIGLGFVVASIVN